MDRGSVLKAGLVTTSLLAVPGIVRAQNKTIVTTSYGALTRELPQAAAGAFCKKPAPNSIMKYGGADVWLNNAVINRAAPEIDLPMLSVPVARAIKIPNLFIDLNTTNVSKIKDVHPLFYDTYEGAQSASNVPTTALSTTRTR